MNVTARPRAETIHLPGQQNFAPCGGAWSACASGLQQLLRAPLASCFIRAILRRAGSEPEERPPASSLNFEGWRLDRVRRTLCDPEGSLVELTAGEYDLLVAFAEHPQHVLTRDQLLDLTRGRVSGPFDRSIDVQVSRLRRKIEADPQQPELIKTVRAGGYIFCAVIAERDEKELM